MKMRSFSMLISAGLLTGLMSSPFAQAQVATSAASTLPKLHLVDSCKPMAQGGRCSVSFEQVADGAAAPGPSRTECTPGWVAHFRAEQGTVESGGIVRGASAVCGYASPEAALRAAIQSCNQQTFVQCNMANAIQVTWVNWQPQSMPAGSAVEVLDLAKLPGAMSCNTGIPVKASAQCSEAAAAQLRAAGLR